MSAIEFFELGEIEDSLFMGAVIVSRYNDKWIYCKHKKRAWEIPGGQREKDESILETAKRELYEETGAVEFDLEPVCVFMFKSSGQYCLLCYADVKKLGELPDSEIEKIDFFDDEPENLSFSGDSDIYPKLFEKVLEFKKFNL